MKAFSLTSLYHIVVLIQVWLRIWLEEKGVPEVPDASSKPVVAWEEKCFMGPGQLPGSKAIPCGPLVPPGLSLDPQQVAPGTPAVRGVRVPSVVPAS